MSYAKLQVSPISSAHGVSAPPITPTFTLESDGLTGRIGWLARTLLASSLLRKSGI